MSHHARSLMLLAALAMALAGCDQKSPEATSPDGGTGLPKTGTYRILALGDSYTIGESVPESERWPVQFAERLRRRGVDAGEPQIVARTGWTTEELSAAIDAARPQGPFDCVTLLIGVNNQYRGRGVEEYRTQFAALLDRAIGFAGEAGKVVVVSIPDYGVTPFGQAERERIGHEADAFNSVNREETAKRKAVYVDITPVSRGGTTRPSLHADDGLHPSGEQYAAWADLVAAAIPVTGNGPATRSAPRGYH